MCYSIQVSVIDVSISNTPFNFQLNFYVFHNYILVIPIQVQVSSTLIIEQLIWCNWIYAFSVYQRIPFVIFMWGLKISPNLIQLLYRIKSPLAYINVMVKTNTHYTQGVLYHIPKTLHEICYLQLLRVTTNCYGVKVLCSLSQVLYDNLFLLY